MDRYVVVTKLTPDGSEAIRNEPDRIARVNASVGQLGARIVHQYATVGQYDFLTVVEAPDNQTVSQIATEISSLGTVRLTVFPAIKQSRFEQLLSRNPYRTEPHRWQTQVWARLLRRVGRHWVMTRHMRRLCKPLEVVGREHAEGVRGPSIVIANHTSHIDTPVLLTALPPHLRERATVAAAADRFYREGKRTWWYSLFWNTYPIARGGGLAALDYSKWLLENGWSIVIYPEGGRFKAGQIQRFHHGPTVLAMQAKATVVPAYLEGLDKLMPKGSRQASPGPVRVAFGEPLSLEGIASVPEGTERLRASLVSIARARL